MRVLFDQGTPVPLRGFLTAHSVETAYEKGWSTFENGQLLTRAEEERFDVLITTDLNLKYQQNLEGRRIAIVVLTTPSWPRIRHAIESVVSAVGAARPGNYVEIDLP